MIASISIANDQAFEYARARLLDGLSLSRSVVPLLVGATAVALVPEGVSEERVLDFRSGGLGHLELAEVAALLGRVYRDASLIVELPLWRPDDVDAPDPVPRIFVCNAEVYAFCSLRDSLDDIEETLRVADPSFMYSAVILEHRVEFGEMSSILDWLMAGTARVVAVLLGAYDGEGFLLMELNGMRLEWSRRS